MAHSCPLPLSSSLSPLPPHNTSQRMSSTPLPVTTHLWQSPQSLQTLHCTSLLQLSWFSFFCSKYKRFTSQATWKGRTGDVLGRRNFSASNDQRKVRAEAAYFDLCHISFSCEIPGSQQLYTALRPFLSYPAVKKEHVDTWVHMKRESKEVR